MSKICTNCGAELPDSAAFCTECGTNVKDVLPKAAEEIKETAAEVSDAAKETVKEAASASLGAAEEAKKTAEDAADALADKASETVNSFTNSASETVNSFTNSASETVNGFANNANETVNGFANNANETVNGFANNANETVNGFANNANETANGFANNANGFNAAPAYGAPYAPEGAQTQNEPVPPAAGVPAGPELCRPLSTGAFFWFILLFAIPVVGLISCIVMAFAAKNQNTRNYAKANLIWVLIGFLFVLLCTIACIIFFSTLGDQFSPQINEIIEQFESIFSNIF